MSGEPVISASSPQPAWCRIPCAMNAWESTSLTCECCRRRSVGVGSPSSAGPAGCSQPSPAGGGWGTLCSSSSKPPPRAVKSRFLKANNGKTHFCPLVLWSALLRCRDCLRQPVPFSNHCAWASASLTFCGGLSVP